MKLLKHNSICFIQLPKINQRFFVQVGIQTHLYHTWKMILKHSSFCICYNKVYNKTIGAIYVYISKARRCTLYVELVRKWQNLFCNPQPTSYSQAEAAEISASFSIHPPSTPRHTCTLWACMHTDSQELGRKRLFFPLYPNAIAGCLEEILVPQNLLGKETGNNPTA